MNDEKMKVWNVPSAVAFVGALVTGAAMLIAASVYKDGALAGQGVTVILVAVGIAAPQPMRGDS